MKNSASNHSQMLNTVKYDYVTHEEVEYGEFEKEVEMSKEEPRNFLQSIIECVEKGTIDYEFEERKLA